MSGTLNARVAAKTQLAEGVVALTLTPVGARDFPAWTPGAHVDLVLGRGEVRQYSLASSPRDTSTWTVAVLREEQGRGGSQFVHDKLEVGDSLVVSHPRNHFEFSATGPVLFIAGGIGVTPIVPMINLAVEAGMSWRLVYGGRRRESMAFLAELEAYGSPVTVVPQDESGLIDLAMLAAELDLPTDVYCCGPESLLAAVEDTFAALPEHTLHVERFHAPEVSGPLADTEFEVVLKESSLTLTVPVGQSVFEVVEEAGVFVPTSCSEGTCGSCETRVVEGEPDHRDFVLSDLEKSANDRMMVCVSRSRSARLVLEL